LIFDDLYSTRERAEMEEEEQGRDRISKVTSIGK
jgi:hypothetical protein